MPNQEDSSGNSFGGRNPHIGADFLPGVPYKKGEFIGGKYEILSLLGKGGFGVVYLVYDRKTHGICALKTFRDEYIVDPDVREAFRREALIWVNLGRHPFILRARFVDEYSRRHYVKMDYVAPDGRGRNCLSHYIGGDGLPVAQILKWGIQFCYGMEYAFEHGVKCHRDIKPSNMLITQDARVQISDFGLAKAGDYAAISSGAGLAGEAAMGSLMASGTRGGGCGTPEYMPPEQFEEAEKADVRNDIYSFGVVLHETVSGRLPFRASPRRNGSKEELGRYWREMHALHACEPLRKLDTPLWSIVERSMRKRREERYIGFEEMRKELEALLLRETGGAVEVPRIDEKTKAWEWNNKGANFNSLGRHEEAIVCHDRALEIDPRYAPAWNNKGGSLALLGRYEEAIVCYDRALEIDPRDAAAWTNKGISLQSLGRNEKAIICLDKALEIDPRHAVAWNNKGNSLESLSHSEEATICYDRALEIDPRYTVAWTNKGNSLQSLGRDEEAIVCYARALEIDPRYAPAWNNKGNSLHSLGRDEEAIVCYARALEIDPRYAPAWNNKGNSLHSLGRYEEAIVCYARALEIDPRYTAAWYNKGNSLHSLGRNGEAIVCYDRALEIDPRHARAWYNRALAEEQLGDVKE
jgi:tetratricopeptide (TPR) repeat protein